jgi:hypothetical protein
MANQWVEFIKGYAKKHKMAYGCAVSDVKAKQEYALKKKRLGYWKSLNKK